MRKKSMKMRTAVLLALSLSAAGTPGAALPLTAMAAPENQAGVSGDGAAGGAGTEGAVQDGQTLSQEEVRISGLEEFLEFGKNCVSESYSKGKTFILETDINLQGTDFQPIPVFAGIFEGNGHGIIGMSVTGQGSGMGLFRYVQEGAWVRNLQVQGSLTPEGSRKNFGGIAGVNRGLIESCVFRGQLTAQEAAGGIAGYNEAAGVIRSCENQGVLTGNLKTGGIVGFNEGLIEECDNRGEVNATEQRVEENSSSSGTQLSFGSVDLGETMRVERVNDSGGVAGLSLGTIRNCVNYKAVGYPHTGYNMGGIAGRQSGLVEACENYGQIRGRKDVGGIVGQFEPYLTVSYDEDMFGSLETQMDELSQMGDSMSKLIEEAGDTAVDNLDRIDEQLKKIRDIGRFYKNIYKEGGDQFDSEADQNLDEIQRILDRMDLELTSGETRSHAQSARENLTQMQNLREQMKQGYEGELEDVEALKQWLELRQSQMEELSKRGEKLKEDLEFVALHGPEDAAEGAGGFADSLEDLQVEVNVLIDVVRVNADKLKTDLTSMDEELTAQVDVLSGNMDALSDDLKESKDQIRGQKNQIQDQIDEMRDTISQGVGRAREERDLFEDISDLETREPAQGMVMGCVNEGMIQADFQAGGIAGLIGMETSLDPEQDLEADQERTLNVTRNAMAMVADCVNRQQVQVKNDYAGGIVGKANLGALIRNQNYGDIIAEDGSYAGGVTGSSAYVLRGNYNMCAVTGNDYTGGIAGWGTDILDNYSMVSFENMDGERRGTVAGDVDPEGVVEGNFYVEEGLGAVDGITYEGQARGLSYEEFRGLEQMPEEFGHLTVEFLVDDQVLKTLVCEYGGSIPEKDIPRVPQKDGYYYVWEQKDLTCVKGNEKVRAVYRPWHTTVASSEDKMPVMLAEADFYPGTSLVMEEKTEGLLAPEGYRIVKGYEYSVRQPEGAAKPERMKLHVLAEGCSGRALAGIVEDGQIRVTDSRRDGAYLVFEMEEPGQVVILEPDTGLPAGLAAGGIILALAAVWLGIRRRMVRKKKRGEAGQEESHDTGDGDARKPEEKVSGNEGAMKETEEQEDSQERK